MNDIVLVPAFHHGSEIEALLQAGVQIKYYEITENLEPDEPKLEALLTDNVRALHLIHYWGKPQDAAKWRTWCDQRGLLLIEDGAQAFLSTSGGQPVGSFGHMAMFCLYKTYGLPDGGILISNVPPATLNANARTGLWRTVRRHFNWLAERSQVVGMIQLQLSPAIRRWRKKIYHIDEHDLQDPNTPPSMLTLRLLPKLLNERTAAKRRENFLFLYRHFSKIVPSAFKSLPEGASPFVFPIEVSNPRAFLEKLKHYGVIGHLFWPVTHPSLPLDQFPVSKSIRERVITLPVHQELTKTHLVQIVDAVNKCLLTEKKQVHFNDSTSVPAC